MKILVQWTQRNPQNWNEIDSSLWAMLPTAPVPAIGQLGGQDNGLGYIFDLNVQGVQFGASDHYAVEDQPDGSLRVTHWTDDPDSLATGESPYGRVWTFWPPAHDALLHGRLIDKVKESRERGVAQHVLPTGRIVVHESEITADAAVNTRQSVITYTDQPAAHAPAGGSQPWAAFPRPPDIAVRHGIWVTDTKAAEHKAAQTTRGWREWAEPVQGEPQFQPHGTITYYGQSASVPVGWVTADNEGELLTTTTTAASLTATIALSSTENAFSWTTQTSNPNVADWPNGDYHVQIDVSAIGADLALENGVVYHRVASDAASSLENSGLTTWNSQTGTGVKLNTDTFDFAAGAADNRFGVQVRVNNASSMKSQDITIQNVNTTTTYADGPWVAAANYRRPIIVGQAVQRAIVR